MCMKLKMYYYLFTQQIHIGMIKKSKLLQNYTVLVVGKHNAL